HRRSDARIFGGEVQREGAPSTETGHADAIGAGPRLLLPVVGRRLDVPEILGARDRGGDLAELAEVLALHPALAEEELGGDRIEAGVGESTDDVLVVLVVPREA